MGKKGELRIFICCDCGWAFSRNHKRRRCDPCLKAHLAAGSLNRMQKVRAKNAAFRERERDNTRARMRKARTKLHRKGLNNMGKPYRTPKRAKMARRFSREAMGRGPLHAQ